MRISIRTSGETFSAPPVKEKRLTVTLAMHAAIPHLLADGPHTLAAAGLDDPGRFARDLLDAVYGRAEEQSEEGAHGHQPVPARPC
ncbi:hypothetical protein [Nonomuraea polychroma]|uniref:hypothetical protein n=1 Tax=Nonomuraea polychroma TaxID=46176 RepID=UPI0019D43C8C|nr:hypothetical protein [Nonomuraea polychroma]